MIQIYKPNKKNQGCALSIQLGRVGKKRELAVFMQSLLQYSWDDKTNSGSFVKNREDPDKNITVKLTEAECGSFIAAIRNRFEFSTFHTNEQNKTSIKLTPWDKKVKMFGKNKEQYETIQPAFGLVITRNGNQTFRTPLEAGECECIAVCLETALRNMYEERFAAREADMQKNFQSKKNNESIEDEDTDGPTDDSAPF